MRNRLNFLQLFMMVFILYRELCSTGHGHYTPAANAHKEQQTKKAQNLEQNQCYSIELTNHNGFYDLSILCSPISAA
jgi:hypothetical protein